MKIKLALLLAFAFLINACQTSVSDTQSQSKTPTGKRLDDTEAARIVKASLTATPTATLPATLTPIAVQPTSTPTPIILTSVEYSEADVETIQKAQEDILIYRQGEITLALQDEEGNPLRDFVVEYEQTGHHFQFMAFDDPPSKFRYLEPIGFNTMNLNLWWTLVEPKQGEFSLEFVNRYRNIEELHSAGITLKGQSILFFADEPNSTPDYLRTASFDELIRMVTRHMSELVSRFAPYIDRWEAILEPDLRYRNPFYLNKAQYLELISASANAIRENDQEAVIEINFSEPCRLDAKLLTKDILDAGIDFDVLGLQYYYNSYVDPKYNYQPPRLSLAKISACLDYYEEMLSPYGKRIAGSEVAVPSEAPSWIPGYYDQPWSQDIQARYLQDIYTIYFSKPSNMAINYWNAVDPSSFVWNSGIVDSEGNPKAAYWILKAMIESWTSEGSGSTDKNGQLNIRGFGGEYSALIINPETGAQMTTVFEILEQESHQITVTFEPDRELNADKRKLEALVQYWQTESEVEKVEKGLDYLALAEHHLLLGERDLAEQTIQAGYIDLTINKAVYIPETELEGNGGYLIEGNNTLLWSSGTAFYQYDFPPGIVEVNVSASGNKIDGKYPTMVIGIGGHYSEPMNTARGSQDYQARFNTNGDEDILTIRFLYEHVSNPGEWKLYIHKVDVKIQTSEIPSHSKIDEKRQSFQESKILEIEKTEQ